MREINTEIIIHAPIEKVWSVLTDFNAYPRWNSFIQRIDGVPKLNARLSVTIQPPGKKPMTFHPKIISLSSYGLTWIGNLGMKGIFDGVHRFLLLPHANGSVKLLHSEKFSGLLHVPIFSLMHQATKSGFEAMNTDFKKRCEIS